VRSGFRYDNTLNFQVGGTSLVGCGPVYLFLGLLVKFGDLRDIFHMKI